MIRLYPSGPPCENILGVFRALARLRATFSYAGKDRSRVLSVPSNILEVLFDEVDETRPGMIDVARNGARSIFAGLDHCPKRDARATRVRLGVGRPLSLPRRSRVVYHHGPCAGEDEDPCKGERDASGPGVGHD